ncbi:MAG: Ig-like domain repeat protein, partial [Ruminococcus sp.]|nr:Ig-like domain repeat protein [Ruminococcus sp.]
VTAGKSWSFYRDIKDGTDAIAEGKYKIHMYALDGAGNLSSLVSREFHVDMAAPVVTATAPQYVNNGTNSDHSRKVTLSGSVSESHGLLSFYIKRNDETGNGRSVTVTDGSWTYEDTPDADGEYTYTFTATDKVGKPNANLTKSVTVDVTAPTVSSDGTKFTVPTASQAEGSMFKFAGAEGSVSDLGLDKVELAFTSEDEEPDAAQTSVTPGAYGTWSSTVEFATNSVFITEGTKYLWVRAKDEAGNASAWTNVKSFVYDTASPTISLTAVTPAEGTYTNAGFTVEAAAGDSYGVEKVEIYNGETKIADAAPSNGKYSKSFVVGEDNETAANYLADGTYSFTVKVTDNAGKTNTATRTVKVDTTLPEGSFAHSDYSVTGNTVGSGNSAKTWYNANVIRFAVEASDANLSTVGIAKTNTSTTVFDAMNLADGKYTGNITGLETGANTVYVKIRDLAGNEKVLSETVYIDTTSPALTYSGNLDFMPQAGFSLSGTSTDSGAPETGSGIADVTIKELHRATDADGWTATDASGSAGVSIGSGTAWTKQIPLGTITEGQYQYVITVKDNAGNEKTDTFETKVDTTKPAVVISNPGSGTDAKQGLYSIDSSSYQFSGSITETNTVKAIYYKIADATATAPAAPNGNQLEASTWTGSGWKTVTAGKSWSFYRDIKDGTDAIAEGKYKIHMYALDGAGNLSSLVSREFH